MTELYHDSYISCTEDGIDVRWYYLWGPKHIPYSHIRSVRTVTLSPAHGKYRIWGTGNPKYWASMDPGRSGKEKAVILDLGRGISPFISPDDLPAFTEALTNAGGITDIQETGPGPWI